MQNIALMPDSAPADDPIDSVRGVECADRPEQFAYGKKLTAEALDVSVRKLELEMKAGRITPSYRLGDRPFFVPEEIRRYVRERVAEADAKRAKEATNAAVCLRRAEATAGKARCDNDRRTDAR